MIETEYRCIKTELPHPDTEKHLKLTREYEPKSMHTSLPIIWEKADNFNVWDIFGNKFIDFTSAIFVTNTGHCQIAKDVSKQAGKLTHSYTFPTLERINLIKQLHDFLPKFCEKIYLASAGSEVTGWAEELIKARYIGTRNSQRNKVAKFSGGFHGKIKDDKGYIELSKPKDNEGFYEYLLNAGSGYDKFRELAGIMIESYEGWSARFLPKQFVQELVAYCKKNDIIICFDEIQGGFYRTGKKFAYEHYGVEPDLICMGKALGGGLPISALAGRKELFTSDTMSSTHSANPICCASASSVLTFFEKSLDREHLSAIIRDFTESLKKIHLDFQEQILEINTTGLISALIFKDIQTASQICESCMKQGLLVVKTGREAVKIGPPLTITSQALSEGMKILYNSVKEMNIENQ